MTWANSYREAAEEHHEITVKGLEEHGPIKVKRNAALRIFKMMGSKFGVTDFSEKSMNEAFASHGIEIVQNAARAVLIEPQIFDTDEEATANNGMTVEDFDLADLQRIFHAIMDDFKSRAQEGSADADTFQSDGAPTRNRVGMPPEQ